jgi:hypothetical protein
VAFAQATAHLLRSSAIYMRSWTMSREAFCCADTFFLFVGNN